MALTIELSPEREAALKAQAQGPRGRAACAARFHRAFDAWMNRHDPNTPVLSDEAISRESIYLPRPGLTPGAVDTSAPLRTLQPLHPELEVARASYGRR
jgi:hypothetical protein